MTLLTYNTGHTAIDLIELKCICMANFSIYNVSKKIPPGFSDIFFTNGWEFLVQILHVPIYTLL